MKNLLLFFVFAASTSCRAQNQFLPIAEEGKSWTMSLKMAINPDVYNIYKKVETKLSGDTTIDGIHFMRKYEREWLRGEEKPDEWTATDEYIGQDGGKVYLYHASIKKKKLDMDFSLKEGDTFTCSEYEDYEEHHTLLVTAVTEETIPSSTDKTPRKCIYLQQQDNPEFKEVWVEGIGSLRFGISGTSYLFSAGAARKLEECTLGGTILYQVYDFSKAIGMTWQLLGFGTVGEDVVQKARPEKGEEWWKEEQYTILFKEDGTLKGHTFSNEFFGEYSIDGNTLVIEDLRATEVGEKYDGDKYYEAFYSPLTHIFEIKNDQLLLYYNEGQNYLLFDNVTNHASAQTYYYYYQGNKIPLTLNESKVCVSIPKDCEKTSETIRANVQTLNTIGDEAFDIYVITRSDFEKLTSLDSWEEDAKSVITTSCYFTEDNKEVVASPYLNIELKTEEDTDLLTSYAGNYGLKVVYKSPFSLWYILALTQDSADDPLRIANELFESGDFASSVPDLVSLKSEVTTVRNISTALPDASPEIYDLQGRRLTGQPAKGIYIQNGKKVIYNK